MQRYDEICGTALESSGGFASLTGVYFWETPSTMTEAISRIRDAALTELHSHQNQPSTSIAKNEKPLVEREVE
jgi:hypothetical protein